LVHSFSNRLQKGHKFAADRYWPLVQGGATADACQDGKATRGK
jgi:hypothetical protein